MKERFMIRADLFVLGVDFLHFIRLSTYGARDRDRAIDERRSLPAVLVVCKEVPVEENPRRFSSAIAQTVVEKYFQDKDMYTLLHVSRCGRDHLYLIREILVTSDSDTIQGCELNVFPVIYMTTKSLVPFFTDLKNGLLNLEYLCGNNHATPYR